MLDTSPAEDTNVPDQYRREAYPVTEWAMKLGCTKSLLYELHHEGKLSIVKLGKKSVIFRDEIERYRRENVMPRGIKSENAIGNHPMRKTQAAAT